ncbi:MAG TPA: GH25 family lysozyme [Polyangia bacterium]|jgi:GH25 family lysozyme M1 (1,4-beta-N-acetylmuramidase)|nr:GH25 family lysozyme [Polyangia bacterium]
MKNRYFLVWLAGALAACGPAAPLDPSTLGEHTAAATVCAGGSTIEGIDVSYYQGTITWSSVYGSGRRFAIVRVSDGTGFQDPNFATYWSGARGVGIVRGAYQFFRPGQSATAQADLMISKLNSVGFGSGDIAPVLDVEVTDGYSSATIVNGINAWVSRIRSTYGRTPLIYTAPGFWSGLGNPTIPGADLWVAHWGVSCPSLPPNWSNWRFWQYTSTGVVSGISGNVDLDRWNGTLADLNAYDAANPPLPSLGGSTAGAPVIARNADGRLEVFARGTGGDMVTTFQTAPNGGWSGWYSLGGSLAGNPAVGQNQDGRLEAFVRWTNNDIMHSYQASPNGSFGAWSSLGAYVTADPVVGRNADGRQEIFVTGTDGYLYHNYQVVPNGGWSGWLALGGLIAGGLDDPRVTNTPDGGLVVFARGRSDGATYYTAQRSGWGTWTLLGGVIQSAPAPGRNADGRLEVFGRGTDGALYHNYETSVGGGWSGWSSLGGGVYDPVVGRDSDGRMEVFLRGTNGGLYRIAQVAPSSGWGGYVFMGGNFNQAPGVGNNLDGRLEVFVHGTDNAVAHAYQVSPGAW